MNLSVASGVSRNAAVRLFVIRKDGKFKTWDNTYNCDLQHEDIAVFDVLRDAVFVQEFPDGQTKEQLQATLQPFEELIEVEERRVIVI